MSFEEFVLLCEHIEATLSQIKRDGKTVLSRDQMYLVKLALDIFNKAFLADEIMAEFQALFDAIAVDDHAAAHDAFAPLTNITGMLQLLDVTHHDGENALTPHLLALVMDCEEHVYTLHKSLQALRKR